MNLQDLYKKIIKIKITHDTITWVLLIGILCSMMARLNIMNDRISNLSNNQTLILYQLEDNEKNVNKANKDIIKVVKNVNQIDTLINKYAQEFNIDPALLHAVATVESGKNQSARSSSNAIGVMQVLPATAKAMGENPYTTEGNIRSGAKYLAYLKNKYKGNEELMLSAYNAGEGNVAKNGNKPPQYTQKYIQKVKNEKQKYNGTVRIKNKEDAVIIHTGIK